MFMLKKNTESHLNVFILIIFLNVFLVEEFENSLKRSSKICFIKTSSSLSGVASVAIDQTTSANDALLMLTSKDPMVIMSYMVIHIYMYIDLLYILFGMR